MPLYALFFLVVSMGGWVLSILVGPFWGLLTYVFVYFNIPNFQWWGGSVPDLRWSLTSALVLAFSCLIHPSQISIPPYRGLQSLTGLVALLLVMIAVAPFSVEKEVAAESIYDFSRYVAIFFLILIVINSITKLRIYLMVLLSQVFFLSWISNSYFTGRRLDGVGIGDAGEANMFAALLVSAIPLFVCLPIGRRWYEKLICWAPIPFVINAFIMCRSRGGFVGLLVSALSLAIGLRKLLSWKLIFVGCAVSVAVMLRLANPAFIDRIGEMPQQSSGSGRTEIWLGALQMVKDHPLGVGGRGFMQLSPKYIPQDILATGVRASHNTFLLVLVEEGAIGLLVYLYFIYALFRGLIEAQRNLSWGPDELENWSVRGKFAYAVSVGGISSLAGMMASFVFLDRLYYECFYLIAALCPVLLNLSNQSRFAWMESHG